MVPPGVTDWPGDAAALCTGEGERLCTDTCPSTPLAQPDSAIPDNAAARVNTKPALEVMIRTLLGWKRDGRAGTHSLRRASTRLFRTCRCDQVAGTEPVAPFASDHSDMPACAVCTTC